VYAFYIMLFCDGSKVDNFRIEFKDKLL